MRKVFLLISTTAILLFLISSCGNPETTAVAKVGDTEIGKEQVIEAIKARFGKNKSLSEITPEQRQEVLDDLVTQEKKRQYARQAGITGDSLYVAESQRYLNRTIALKMYEDQVTGHLIGQERLKRYLKWDEKDIEVVYIQIAHQESIHLRMKRTRAEAAELAKKYRAALAEAPDPVAYAKSVTDQPRKLVEVGRYFPGRFNYQADSLVYTGQAGQTIDPLDTQFGFVIIKIINIAPAANPTGKSDEQRFADLRNSLRPYIRDVEQNYFDELSRKYRTEANFAFHDEEAAAFVENLQRWGRRPGHTFADLDSSKYSRMALAGYNGYTFYSGEMIQLIGPRILRDWAKIGNVKTLLDAYVLPHVNLEVWAAEGRKMGLAERADVRQEMAEYDKKVLPQLLDKVRIEDKLSSEISPEELERFFAEHQSEFRDPEKYRVYRVLVDSRQKAETVAAQAKSGVPFIDLYNQHKNPESRPRFDLGYLTDRSRFPRLLEEAKKIGPKATSDPMEFGEEFCVIQTGDFIPAKDRSLDEVRDLVQHRLLQERRQALSDQLSEEINRAISHTENKKLLQELG
ncbi:MAG TPA: peptidyl-prolyl cis-trans isomerase [Calditrichia bacterium]|nr:peptidyl-prolyl cis-trans isomerase [Calditrichota bacterium]HQU70918.1 peptidyl-prolyl cis-trans isomerase [Calditrichia bacterium]HQV30236.1 peptidyl-prolyl cis-trans isomerase [Calditrichia bacterium]